MRNTKKIAKVIKKALAPCFEKVQIIDVWVYDEVACEGDAVLLVDVIFEGTRKDVDAQKLTGAVRHVRPKLRDIGETAFPLFSFISKKDYRVKRSQNRF